MELNKIHNIDCLEFMKTLPDKCIDLVLTDPPYGINFGSEKDSMSNGLRKDGSRRIYKEWSAPKSKNYVKWDDVKPTKEMFDEIMRVSKYQIIWGGNYFDLPLTGGWLIWNKGVVMPTLSKCELAWTSFLGHTEIIHYLWAGFRKERPEERYHTTQKPQEVMGWCLNFLPEVKTVFDPFMGSGTTAVVAKLAGKDYIGCEISPEYCKIAEERINSISNSLF